MRGRNGGAGSRVNMPRARMALRAEQTRLSAQEQMHKPVGTLSGVGSESSR